MDIKEAKTLFEILSVLKDIQTELKSIKKKIERPSKKGGAEL